MGKKLLRSDEVSTHLRELLVCDSRTGHRLTMLRKRQQKYMDCEQDATPHVVKSFYPYMHRVEFELAGVML